MAQNRSGNPRGEKKNLTLGSAVAGHAAENVHKPCGNKIGTLQHPPACNHPL